MRRQDCACGVLGLECRDESRERRSGRRRAQMQQGSGPKGSQGKRREDVI